MIDLHTHTKYCNHALGSVDEIVQSGIRQDLQIIGISDHFPMVFFPAEINGSKYSMKIEEFPRYLEDIIEAKKKFSEIKILSGTELDYYGPNFNAIKKEVSKYRLDYKIGSVHVILMEDNIAWNVEDKRDFKNFEKYTFEKAYRKYINELMNMVNTRFYQVVGHCDGLKKNGFKWSKEFESEMIDLEDKFIEAVKKSNMAIEINTSGLRKKVKNTLPSPRIIKKIIEEDIPITLGSDAHDPKDVAFEFDR